MTEHVDLYLGTYEDLSDEGKDFFERVDLVSANSTRSPADLKKHYNVQVTVKSKQDGQKYSTEIDSRTINNWFTRFEKIIEDELRSEDGLEGEYRSPNQRNPLIVKTLSKLVPFWINTKSVDTVE